VTLILDLLAQAEAVLGEVARIDRSTLSDEELVAVLQADERVGRFSDACRVFDAGEVADRSRYELGAAGLSMRHGEPKPTIFVEQATRVSQSEASRRIRLGAAVRQRQSLLGEVLPAERPILAEAMTHGVRVPPTCAPSARSPQSFPSKTSSPAPDTGSSKEWMRSSPPP
jgi:hypothetical protein